MTSQRLLIVLTLVNLAMLIFLVNEIRPIQADTVPTVLRGRALELVDDHGRVRVDIKVLPAQPTFRMPDGTTGYPETVQLRLISSNGRPNVKLAATEDGSGLVLAGESDPTYAQIRVRGASGFVKLVNKDGRQQLITP